MSIIVTRSALQNTASIAGLLLTTEALVTEIPEKEKTPPMPPSGMGGMEMRNNFHFLPGKDSAILRLGALHISRLQSRGNQVTRLRDVWLTTFLQKKWNE